MRLKTFFRMLRIIAAVTLFFFAWSFLPIYAAVAYAAEGKAQSADPSQSPLAKGGSRGVGQMSGERFEKALDAIRENVSRAGEKVGKADDKAGRGDAATGEIDAIKKQRAAIEAADVEFKKEFAATEKKLKDAKLPQEILDRHAKFVTHYEDNLKELKTNLDDVEKLKADNRQLRAALSKAKAHLEKTKAPSKHVPLDPNNLPNRMVKAKARAPRLKKEEFEKDFPAHKKATRLASLQAISDTDGKGFTRIKQKPLLLAYNEIASDVPLQLPRPLEVRVGSAPECVYRGVRGGFDIPQLAFADSTSLLLAQAVALPTSDDLAQTPEIQFTQDIIALASQLNNNPVKIYNWVRNNIEYAPTYGSIQGADMCLQSKICNDMDTASLLIALLRVSGISAHYDYGTIEVPIDKAMNWVGGVTNPQMAGTVLATNGIPAISLISGSTIRAIQLEHVWVKAFIDYIPSRGAVQRQGNTWIPLDASYKQYNYAQGIDIIAAVPFDAQSFTNQILSTATTNTTDGSVTNVNSTLVQQTMQGYQTQVQNFIQQTYPNATLGDVIGKKEIIQKSYPILLGTLPYRTVQVGSEFATVPDNLRETMSFNISDPTGTGTGLTYTTGMPQIVGKKITLSFSPATVADQAVIDSFQVGQEPTSLPAYLINLKPDLSVDGVIVATGAAITMGSALSWTISLNEPGIGLSNINNTITAGQYFGIGLDTGRIGMKQLNDLKTKLLSTKSGIESGNFGNYSKDDLVGDILYSTISSYFAELDTTDEIISRNMNIVRYRAPSIGMFSIVLDSNEIFGMPISISQKGMMMDVDRLMQAVFSKDGDMNKVKQYMLVSGNNSSALEHSVPEQLYSTATEPVNGISALKVLKIANDQGVPIYTIIQSNVGVTIPQLQIDENAKVDIVNAVNAGKIVTVSKTNITMNGWSGCGYTIVDPTTGAGAYMIAGGFSGALIQAFFSSITDLIGNMAQKGYINSSNTLKFVGKLAAAATVISFGITMYNIVMNPNLTLEQKISDIIVWTLATVGALWVGGLLIALNPFFAVVAITALYLLFTAIALELSFSE